MNYSKGQVTNIYFDSESEQRPGIVIENEDNCLILHIGGQFYSGSLIDGEIYVNSIDLLPFSKEK